VFEQCEMPWVDVNAKDITEGQKEELPSRRRSCEEMLLGKWPLCLRQSTSDVEAGRGGGGVPSGHCASCERAAVPHAGILYAALT
jgi:hypothetical protein